MQWSDDAAAVAAAVKELPAKAGLPPGAPVFVGGASSGGSLALRLPLLVRFAGAFGGARHSRGRSMLRGLRGLCLNANRHACCAATG